MMINKRILKTGALAVAMTLVFAILAFRAADWTKGLNSEFLVYGASSSGSTTGGGGTGGGGGVSSNPTTKVLPQISAGFFENGTTFYGTVIEVVNPNSSAITVNGNFYKDDGSASDLTFATNVTSQPTVGSTFTNLNVPANGILVLSVGTNVQTTPANGTSVWGILTGSNTISVSSFYEYRLKFDSSLRSRVGIASSLPNMTSFVIPRVRERVSLTQVNEIETGFAVVNTGAKAATLTAKLIDAGGNTIASASFPLAPNAHKVGIVNSAFSFLSNETAGRQYQYILFTSDQPTIGAAAIAYEGSQLTSFPVDPIS